MKKRTLLLALATALTLCVSALAAEPESEWCEVDVSSQLIQCGGYPDAAAYAVQPYSLREASQWEGAKAALRAGLKNWDIEIDLSEYEISTSEIGKLYAEVVNEDPSLFYAMGYSYRRDGNYRVTFISPQYDARYTKADVAKYEKKVSDILTGLDDNWSDLEKALYLHDYLASHFKYDTTYSRYDAYSLLVEGTGVCQAYTLAYKDLLNRAGIENGTVQSSKLKHIWNLVEIDGEWYHVDVTWDDPTNNAMGQSTDAPDLTGNAQHTYFLLSDDTIRDSEHKHGANDWVVSPADVTCPSTAYDNWWGKSVTSPFAPLGDDWYYISSNGLYSTDAPETKAGSNVLYLANYYWKVWNGSGWWIGTYSGLCAWRDLLVFNTPTQICSYDPETGETNALYTPDTSNGYVYGLAMDGDKATYLLAQDPNLTGWATGEVTLRPYENNTAADWSACQVGDTFYLRQDAANGILALARYDANGRMTELQMTNTRNGELSTGLKKDGSTLKIFALNSSGKPISAAETVKDE